MARNFTKSEKARDNTFNQSQNLAQQVHVAHSGELHVDMRSKNNTSHLSQLAGKLTLNKKSRTKTRSTIPNPTDTSRIK